MTTGTKQNKLIGSMAAILWKRGIRLSRFTKKRMKKLTGLRTRVAEFCGMRWRRFTFPNGRKRTFNLLKWEWRDRILVGGEFLAFCAAIATVPFELNKWSYAPWLIVGATIVGTAALLWYAFDLISAGESPLTNRSAHNIRQVVNAIEMEKEGVTFDWDNIDERGGIPSDMTNWSKLRPDLKEIMNRLDVPLMVAVQILAAQERDSQSTND